MRLDQLIKRLKALKDKGFVPSRRKGPTGVGYTFEEELGLKESNIPIPDLGGRTEIKASRLKSGSLITLFTFNRGAWNVKQDEVIETFGYKDENNRRALYSMVGVRQPNQQGLYLTLGDSKKFLVLMHSAGKELARWKISHLIAKFLGKMPRLLLGLAESRETDSGREEFHYTSAYLCANPSDDRFVEAIVDGTIFVDIRMHLRKNDSVRNHGTAFRVKEEKLYEFYETRKKLI